MSPVGIGAIVYGTVGLLAARGVAGHLAWEYGEPDPEDWVMGIVAGLFLGGIWPVFVFGWLLKTLPLRVGAEAAAVKREREYALREREARIARMERELGL